MENQLNLSNLISWLFGLILISIGLMNIFLVHPVPGVVYVLLSLVYLPPANRLFENRLGFRFPVLLKILLGLVIFFFTLGVSDLAEMYGL